MTQEDYPPSDLDSLLSKDNPPSDLDSLLSKDNITEDDLRQPIELPLEEQKLS